MINVFLKDTFNIFNHLIIHVVLNSFFSNVYWRVFNSITCYSLLSQHIMHVTSLSNECLELAKSMVSKVYSESLWWAKSGLANCYKHSASVLWAKGIPQETQWKFVLRKKGPCMRHSRIPWWLRNKLARDTCKNVISKREATIDRAMKVGA